MPSYTIVLLLVTSSLHLVSSIDYYVVPNGAHYDGNNTHELNYYLNKHFTPNSQLHFKPGVYYLENDFIMTNVYHISIIGHNATIICQPNVGLTFINITNMTLECMSFMNCEQDYRNNFALNYSHHIKDKTFSDKVYGRKASIVFYNSSLAVRHISLSCRAGVHALMIANMIDPVRLYNITVLMNIKESSNSSIISSGIFLHFHIYLTAKRSVSVSLKKFKFTLLNSSRKKIKNYDNFSFIAASFLLLNTNLSANISITDLVFANFQNSMTLFYYAKYCRLNSQRLYLNKIQGYKNKANLKFPLLFIVFQGFGFDFKSAQYCKQKSRVIILNSIFKSNMNITAIIHVKLKNTLLTATNITIYNCTFIDNMNTGFVITDSEINSLLQLTHTIKLKDVKIIDNTNDVSRVNLLSFSRCHPKFEGPIIIMGNKYYENIATLYFAALRFHGNISISKNKAYMLVNTLENSYFVFEENVKVEIVNNTFHNAVRNRDWMENLGLYDNTGICMIQFYSLRGNLDNEFAKNKSTFNYMLFKKNNIITQPQYLSRYELGLNINCSWLSNMAFETTSPIQVEKAFVKSSYATSTKADVYAIPSKLCYCTDSSSYNCTKREVGPVFPGQLLKLPLMIPSLNSPTWNKDHYYTMLTARTQGIPSQGCIIENVSEIFQIHKNYNCNEYTYTIKYSSFNECELYLRTQQDDTEIVYVKMKPCPPGFVLETDMCICDPLLKSEPLSVSTCSLDNETILRPENSWISAEPNTYDYSYTYHVSVDCPFHYCLPHPSHLNLSNPDSQCQYNRAGILCVQCQKGLSVVFGSFKCKRCTNYYLLIIVPMFIIILLILVLVFMFNLTITNGTINTFIFYIDIVDINLSLYSPNCCTILCMFAPSIETCFYNGMNQYSKVWLSLCYPLFFIFIAILLIIASRRSVIFQRLTARRALPVLATLALVSFTGLLRIASFVLFGFKVVTSIPGEHSTTLWVIDANTALFGPKFILLYFVCLIFFLILLMFNVLLLFTKELLQFKIINKIKPFLDVYLGPYKHGFSYWTGLQLLIRIAIFGLTATDHDINLMTSTILLVVLLWIQAIAQPFKSKFHNFQQSLVLVDIIMINIISLYNRDNNHQAFIAISVLIHGGSLYFIICIIFHCVTHAFGKTVDRGKVMLIRCCTTWKLRLSNSKKFTEKRIRMASLRNKIDDVTYNYQEFQEPLIEIDL